jgi:hypothetical protein
MFTRAREAVAIVLSSAAGLWKLFRDQAERGSGIALKLFGFIAEPAFTIIPESCSGSSRYSVRNHPGIALTLHRIPLSGTQNGEPEKPLWLRLVASITRYEFLCQYRLK